MMDSGWTVPFILRNQTVNLTEELSNDVLERVNDQYLDAILRTARDPQSGDLHALPFFPDLGFTLYREDLIEDAGYDTNNWPSEPPSWEEFSAAVHDARDQAGLNYGFTTQAAAYEGLSCCTFNEVMTSWGGAYFGGVDNLFTAGDRPITVDEERCIDAIRMMRSFIEGEEQHTMGGYARSVRRRSSNGPNSSHSTRSPTARPSRTATGRTRSRRRVRKTPSAKTSGLRRDRTRSLGRKPSTTAPAVPSPHWAVGTSP